MLTMNQLLAKLQVSRAMIYKMIKKHGFPPPHKFGSASRWSESDVDKWVSKRGKSA